MASKKILRDTYLLKRKLLTDLEFSRRNQALLILFRKYFQESDLQYFHCFLPISKNREPDTWLLVDWLVNLGKKVVVSKSDLETNTMRHFVYEGQEQLVVNKWGIPEPGQGEEVSAGKIDVVLVPSVVWDRTGQRIGYGKGYYDRFLQECRPDVLKAGISITPPLDKIIYAEPHDLPLDISFSHLGVYQIST